MEQRGKFISFLCIALIVAVVVSIFYFVASKDLLHSLKIRLMCLISYLEQTGTQVISVQTVNPWLGLYR